MLTPSACSLSGFSGLIVLVEVTDRLDTGYRSGVARYDGLITIGRNQIYDSSFTWEDPKKKDGIYGINVCNRRSSGF